MEEKPNYYAIIPANVRYDATIKDKSKLLYAEITALTQKEGKCWASNHYFANLYGVSVQTISSLLKDLEEKGYISRTIIYKEGTKEILHRYIKILDGGYTKNLVEGMQENFKDNNTSINNTSINNKEIYKESWKYFDSPELEEAFNDYVEMRKKLKAPMTEKAIKLAIDKLFKLSNGDEHLMVEIINQSVMNSWKGLFELKGATGQTSNNQKKIDYLRGKYHD